MKHKQQGFGMVETLLSVAAIGTLAYFSYSFYSYTVKQNSRVNQTNQLLSFSRATANFVKSNQAKLYMTKTTIPVKTISPELLNTFGYTDLPAKIKDSKTGSIMYPCASIYVNNNKIQGFAYFRTDDVRLSNGNLNEETANAAKSLGGYGGIVYANPDKTLSISANSKNWKLTQNDINTYFKQNGGDWLSNGLGDINNCKGKYVVSPSFTYNLGYAFLDVNEEYNKDNSLKQNSNDLFGNSYNNTVDGINLDATGIGNEHIGDIQQNKLVFQSNPNCVMNPSILSTMQDYDDTNHDGNNGGKWDCPPELTAFSENWLKNEKCAGITKPNKWGCRNKQLAIGADNGNVTVGEQNLNVNLVKINGFNEVGDNTGEFGKEGKLNLSGLSADSIQATAEVGYAEKCSVKQIGALARQKPYDSGGTDKLKQLYSLNRSLLVCQRNILCPQNGGGIGTCWMSLSNVTSKINFAPTDKIVAFTAPTGFYIKEVGYYNVDTSFNISQIANNKQYNLGFGASGNRSDSGYHSRICNHQKTCSFGLWSEFSDSHGDLLRPDIKSSNILLSSVAEDSTLTDVYVPYKDAIFNEQSKYGFSVKVEIDQNTPSFNFTQNGSYFTNSGSSDSKPVFMAQKNSYFTNNAFVKYNLDNEGRYQKQLNVRYQIAQTVFHRGGGNNGNCRPQDCDAWKSGKILSRPYFIKYVVLSNNVDEIPIGSNYNGDKPVIIDPPAAVCNNSTIPSDMKNEAAVQRDAEHYDMTDGTKLILYGDGSSYQITSTNYSNYVCKVEASALYCPDTSIYKLVFNMAQSNTIFCVNSNSFTSTCQIADLKTGDSVNPAIKDRYDLTHTSIPIVLDNNTIKSGGGNVTDTNGAVYGTYTVTKTSGSSNNCSNPTRLTIYENTY